MKQLGLGVLLIMLLSSAYGGMRYKPSECVSAVKPDLNNDGIVNYKEIWQVGRSYALTTDDYRYNPASDINCDQRVDETDWDYVWQAYGQRFSIVPAVGGYISVHLPDKMYVGKKQTVKGHISLYAYNQMAFTANLSQKIIPEQGLLLENTLKAKRMLVTEYKNRIEGKQDFLMYLTPQKPGKYHVVFAALVTESGKRIVDEHDITVLDKNKADIKLDLFITQLGSNTVLPESQQYTLNLQINATGKDIRDIKEVLYVDEKTGNSYKKHAVHGEQRIAVGKAFVEQRLCRSFHVVVSTEYDTVTGDSVQFCAQQPEATDARVPGSLEPKLHSYVSQTEQSECSGKHLLVGAKAGVPLEEVHDIVVQSGGWISAYQQFGLRHYQVFPIMGDSNRQWQELATFLRDYPEISWVQLVSYNKPLQECPELQTVRGDESAIAKMPEPFKAVTHDAYRWDWRKYKTDK